MSDETIPTYEVLALRYGTQTDRRARENFLFPTGQSDSDMTVPFDFYMWVIRNDRHVLVVDTGFSREAAAVRGRTMLTAPRDGLVDLGIAPSGVSDVVITHMHYDHAGNLGAFPSARIHLQEEELRFCTGRAMRHEASRKPFEPADVTTTVQRLFDGHVVLHRGPFEVIPGVTVHPVGGHTPGIQVVRVHTERGWVVLASDTTHLWANIRRRSPFPILDNLTTMLEAYDVVESLADGEDHVIPGHDPQVALRFPRFDKAPEWVCLHEPPSAWSPLTASVNGAAG
jgi:glyoxylase-like metal-dependent hydrolase (beta-lactamase superfamily II)